MRMKPPGFALLSIVLLASPAAAGPPQDPPPAPDGTPAAAPPGPPGPANQPLPAEEVDRRIRRAEQNLVLHGLSLDPKYVVRAISDAREAAAGLPADAGAKRTFSAWFTLAFALVRVDPADRSTAESLSKEALAALEAAAKADPNQPALWIVDGIARELVEENAVAVEHITTGLGPFGDPKAGPLPWPERDLRLLGLLARGRARLALQQEFPAEKDFEGAVALAEEALRDPAAPRENGLRRVVLNNLAHVQQSLQYFEKAEKTLERLVREDPANFLHPYNLALVKAQQHRYPEAVACHRRATELNPRSPLPHLKVAFILLNYYEGKAGPDVKTAAEEGEIYRGLVGEEDAEYCAIRGEIATVRGDPEEAERWFRRSLEKNPYCQRSLSRLVQILGSRGDLTESRRIEVERLRKRLEDSVQNRRDGKEEESQPSRKTFC